MAYKTGMKKQWIGRPVNPIPTRGGGQIMPHPRIWKPNYTSDIKSKKIKSTMKYKMKQFYLLEKIKTNFLIWFNKKQGNNLSYTFEHLVYWISTKKGLANFNWFSFFFSITDRPVWVPQKQRYLYRFWDEL